ncbi:MAG TPA: GTPase [Pirellulaceae bacterium]|jgi:hypothetical protein|nr:GTPase [Pirellulaceae bacterium]
MAANLTPQYRKAEEAYRRAESPLEELRCLEVMLREMPKHKGTDRLQADLKTKISRARADAEAAAKAPKKTTGFRLPRQGAGRVVVIGGPNGGKSSLLAALTRATPEIAPYPFTTRQPLPGMLEHRDVPVQVVDTPPVTEDLLDADVVTLIRGADLVLFVVGLFDDEGVDAGVAAFSRFAAGKTRLGNESRLDEQDVGVTYTRTFLVRNGSEDPQFASRAELLAALCPTSFHSFDVSATTGAGLEALKSAIVESLDVVRIYTKSPARKEPDAKPVVVKRGSVLLDVAEALHHELAANLKSARVWSPSRPGTMTVGADYVVEDRDVVELHSKG